MSAARGGLGRGKGTRGPAARAGVRLSPFAPSASLDSALLTQGKKGKRERGGGGEGSQQTKPTTKGNLLSRWNSLPGPSTLVSIWEGARLSGGGAFSTRTSGVQGQDRDLEEDLDKERPEPLRDKVRGPETATHFLPSGPRKGQSVGSVKRGMGAPQRHFWK